MPACTATAVEQPITGAPQDGGASANTGFDGSADQSASASTSTSGSAAMGEGGSPEGGPTILASEIQLTPTTLVSDGTSLFWVSSVGVGGPALSMPVTGGAMNTVVAGPLVGGLIAVDDVNFYYSVGIGPGLSGGGLESVPKVGGGALRLVNEPTDAAAVSIVSFTVLGDSAYWLEVDYLSEQTAEFEVKSAPLLGGAVTTLGVYGQSNFNGMIGVTSTTVFLTDIIDQIASFPMSQGIPDGGVPTPVAGFGAGTTTNYTAGGGCALLVSDTNAVICEANPYIYSIASGGTVTTLGTVIGGGNNVAVDDTYVYWLDTGTVGTVMRVPKAGGTPTVIARDTQPVAIAVDANAVYWSDQGGNIMRLNK